MFKNEVLVQTLRTDQDSGGQSSGQEEDEGEESTPYKSWGTEPRVGNRGQGEGNKFFFGGERETVGG